MTILERVWVTHIVENMLETRPMWFGHVENMVPPSTHTVNKGNQCMPQKRPLVLIATYF